MTVKVLSSPCQANVKIIKRQGCGVYGLLSSCQANTLYYNKERTIYMEEKRTYRTDFYTPDDVMKILHLGKTQVYKLFKSDTFPSLKIGGSLRVDVKRFEDWCDKYAGRNYIL